MTRPDRHTSRWSWAWARRAVSFSVLLALVLAGKSLFPWVRGSLSATTWFGSLPLVDPLAALEVTLASRTLSADMLLGAGIILALTAVLGPVFCSWVCPLGLLLELCAGLAQGFRRKLLGRRRPPVAQLSSSHWRWLVLGAVLGFSAISGLPTFQILSPINALPWALAFGSTVALAGVAVLVILEWRWPRIWCRSLCPLGAVHALAGRFGRLRVQVDRELAGRTPCLQCSRECPMGIPVMEEFALRGRSVVDHPDCTRCGACVDVCPSGVLRLGLRGLESSGRSTGSSSAEGAEPVSCGVLTLTGEEESP